MRHERPYCGWCRGKEGGCLYCGAAKPVPETKTESFALQLDGDQTILFIRHQSVTEVWRIPPPDPDREPCVPDPAVARLFDERTPEQRRVSLARWDEELFRYHKWAARRRKKRRTV